MEHQSDEDIASTITASTQKKSQSLSQDLNASVLSQQELKAWWPFTRVDPRILERAHKNFKAQQLANAEPAPY